jgi:hypothetical protein
MDKYPRRNRLRALACVFEMLAVGTAAGLLPSCSSTPTPSASATAVPGVAASSAEDQRVQAFLDSRYTSGDVKHSFRTKFGETIDCIDFFAQASVKRLAAHGTPIPNIPTPPSSKLQDRRGPHTSPLPDYMFNGSLDENGNSRACEGTTVPMLRITAEQVKQSWSDTSSHRSTTKSGPPMAGAAPAPQTQDVLYDDAGVGGVHAQVSVDQSRTPPPLAPKPLDSLGYAHVVQSLYPGGSGSANITEGGAIGSINTITIPADYSHSLIQVWMTSGWAFKAQPGSCGVFVAGAPPCVQSVETGWIASPSLAASLGEANVNADHFFIFATPDGYDTGCYDNVNGIGGECSVDWVAYPGSAIVIGMQLPSNPSNESEYELDALVLAGAQASIGGVYETGWWIASTINNIPENSFPPYQYVGYYTYAGYNNVNGSSYDGLMGQGEAQEFQAGAEVSDSAVTASDGGAPFEVPMATSNQASSGYNSAAYVYDVADVEVDGWTFVPYFTTGDTVPSTYAAAYPAFPETAPDGNYFYVGYGVDTYIWSPSGPQFPIDSTAIPAAVVPATPPLTRGKNSVTIAPTYTYESTIGEAGFLMAVLVASNNDGEGDNLVKIYGSVPSGFRGAWFSGDYKSGGTRYPLYLSGITYDSSDGALWGWNKGGSVYSSDGETSVVLLQTGYTSVSAFASDNILATANYDSGCAGPPVGDCLYASGSPSGSWTKLPEGASQVALDTLTSQAYELDSGGRIWAGETELPQTACSVAPGAFVQIAAKNNIVFALDANGTVWYYGGVKGDCWAEVGAGTKNTFAVSIATDNAAGSLIGVWAVDESGALWTAQ